jgi:hypothetical protein
LEKEGKNKILLPVSRHSPRITETERKTCESELKKALYDETLRRSVIYAHYKTFDTILDAVSPVKPSGNYMYHLL